jgi:formylglycine-generating enzyme required for sulfatase activity
MGRNDGDQYERPAHQVTVKPFFIDSYEVTNEEYAKFIRETDNLPPPTWTDKTYPAGTARRPVTGVTWDNARAYAAWAGKHLPTDEEWEFAARGAEGRRYPWGNEWRAGLANAEGAASGMVDVGTNKGASPFGAFDMVGNAWEWTDSKLIPYPGGSLPIKISDDIKVIRGGTYSSNRNQATTTYRRGWRASAESDYSNTGFRCVKAITNN